MTPARNRSLAVDNQPDDSNAAVIAELRTMNRLLAAFTTRDMDSQKAIMFLNAAGFGPVQIAGLLAINPVTVRTTLFRARKAAEKSNAKANPQRAVSTESITDHGEEIDTGDANGNA